LNEQGKKFKITMKKSYIYDILMQSKAQINLAQRVFLIVSNN